MSTINEPTWITKNGDEIKISKMTDKHLENTIKFLERTFGGAKNYLKSLTVNMTNEKIANTLEDVLSELEDLGPGVINSTYTDLIKEFDKRKKEVEMNKVYENED